jgi:hypothetical protein
MLNPTTLRNGHEQHEEYKDRITKKTRVQFDYRHTDGELFSCIKPTLEDCWAALDGWIKAKEAQQ